MNLIKIVQVSPTKYKVAYRTLSYKIFPVWKFLADSMLSKDAEFFSIEHAEKEIPALLSKVKWYWQQKLFWNKTIKVYNDSYIS